MIGNYSAMDLLWMSNPLTSAWPHARELWNEYFYLESNPITVPPQSTFTPAAPRSRAEMQSGWWTPDDALLFGQEETRRQIANRTQGTAVIPASLKDGDNTLLWILGAVAVTGVLIAVVRK